VIHISAKVSRFWAAFLSWSTFSLYNTTFSADFKECLIAIQIRRSSWWKWFWSKRKKW